MKRTEDKKFGRKILLSIVGVMGFAIQYSAAQTSSVNLGITVGPSYGSISSDIGSYTGSIGYQAAGNIEWRIANHIGLSAEAQMISVTTNSAYNDSIQYYNKILRINYNTSLNINFTQFSFLFKYYIPLGTKPITPYDRPEGSGNYFTLMLGPYFSMVGKTPSNTGKIKLTSHYVDTSQHNVVIDSTLTKGGSNSSFTSNGLAVSTYGVTVGAGVNLRIAKGLELTFDLRYTRDLATLDNPLVQTVNVGGVNVVTNYGFMGHRYIDSKGLEYTAANAFANFICFNVGLNVRLFSIGG